jgi:hypothetical protein
MHGAEIADLWYNFVGLLMRGAISRAILLRRDTEYRISAVTARAIPYPVYGIAR